MPRKRDKLKPEELLRGVLTHLESDNPRDHRRAILDLIGQGPLLCEGTLHREMERPATEEVLAEYSSVRDELLAWVRDVVARKTSARLLSTNTFALGHGISIHGDITYHGVAIEKHRVTLVADGPMRPIAYQQCLLLIYLVGLDNVRPCEAKDCQHVFVKTYRREFCSTLCQERTNKQKQRLRQKQERVRAQRRRVVARRG